MCSFQATLVSEGCKDKQAWICKTLSTKAGGSTSLLRKDSKTLQNRWRLSSRQCITSQNGQTYFTNLAAFAARSQNCVWLFWNVMH